MDKEGLWLWPDLPCSSRLISVCVGRAHFTVATVQSCIQTRREGHRENHLRRVHSLFYFPASYA